MLHYTSNFKTKSHLPGITNKKEEKAKMHFHNKKV